MRTLTVVIIYFRFRSINTILFLLPCILQTPIRRQHENDMSPFMQPVAAM